MIGARMRAHTTQACGGHPITLGLYASQRAGGGTGVGCSRQVRGSPTKIAVVHQRAQTQNTKHAAWGLALFVTTRTTFTWSEHEHIISSTMSKPAPPRPPVMAASHTRRPITYYRDPENWQENATLERKTRGMLHLLPGRRFPNITKKRNHQTRQSPYSIVKVPPPGGQRTDTPTQPTLPETN
jgi:hypothetical protein